MSTPTVRSGPSVVAFGGGHGLAASLRALREVAGRLTAVVTVADDGGSSGRLRDELAALPPGDLRMALVALAAGDEETGLWCDLFQHRFAGDGPLAGHAVGNLVLVGLAQRLQNPVEALAVCGRLLGTAGRVLPMSSEPVDIEADVLTGDGGRELVRGQVAVATARGRVEAVRLLPPDPPVCPDVLAAIADADALVLGPGSFFTSVLPHLLVPELAKAVTAGSARRLFVLNLAAQPGETEGFSPETHLEELARHVPDLRLDAVVADPSSVPDDRAHEALTQAAERLGAIVSVAPVAEPGRPVHDPARLAAAFRDVMGRLLTPSPSTEPRS